MSINKWLINEKSLDEKKRKDEAFNKLPLEKVQELKKKSVQKLTRQNLKSIPETNTLQDDFLHDIVMFKDWLDKRTYLKGDREKIQMWILNLHEKLQIDLTRDSKSQFEHDNNELKLQYKKIPLKFFDEKVRIAITKKLNGTKIMPSDNYHLKKLKAITQEKLKEASYYDIINRILQN